VSVTPEPSLYKTWQEYANALNVYLMDNVEHNLLDPSKSIAILGTNTYLADGITLATDLNIRNDLAMPSSLGGLNQNPTFQLPRFNAALGYSPASWWKFNSTTYLNYEDDTIRGAVKIPASDAVVGLSAAMRVNTALTYRILVLAKKFSGTAYINLAAYELDGDLSTGQRAVMAAAGSNGESVVVAGTRINGLTTTALTTTYAVYSITYTPTGTAKWFSAAFYASNGAGSVATDPIGVEWCLVAP